MFILNNQLFTLNSALEQFEIITLNTTSDLAIFKKILSFFIPFEIFNNLSLSILLIIFYLWAVFDLKEIREINTLKFSVLSSLNYSNTKNAYPIKYFYGIKHTEILFESVYLIHLLYNFVNAQILSNLTYFKSIFLNYILSLFIFILTCNILGMVPYSLTISSFIILTINLSGMTFFGNLLIVVRIYKLKFLKFFIPMGITNNLLVILMVAIEFISYVARLFSMAIRLFANMLSGHALIKILCGLFYITIAEAFLLGFVSILFEIILLAVTGLEFIVACLQAYVFTTLSVIYLNEAIISH